MGSMGDTDWEHYRDGVFVCEISFHPFTLDFLDDCRNRGKTLGDIVDILQNFAVEMFEIFFLSYVLFLIL